MKPRLLTTARLSFPLATAIAAMLATHPASGQTASGWRGGTSTDMQTATNWDNGFGNNFNLFFGQAWHNAGRTGNTTINNASAYSGYRLNFENITGGANQTFTLQGSAITLFDFGVNNPAIINSSNVNQIINAPIVLNPGATGVSLIQANGATGGNLTFGGTLSLAGTNQLRISGANANTVSFGGIISATGTNTVVVSQGSSNITVVYNAANTYNGDTFIDSGTLQFGTAASSAGSANSSTLRLGANSANSDAATINLATTAGGVNVGSTIVVRPSSSGSQGTRTLSSSNTSGTNTFSGGVALDAVATITSTNSGGTLAFTGATLELKTFGLLVNGSGNTTISNLISSTGAGNQLTKAGTGTLSLTGNNNYTGTTAINAGTLAISNNTALGTTAGNTTIAATGESTGPRLALSGNINSAENITLTGNSDQNQFNGVIYNTSGTNTLSGNVTLANPAGNIRITSGGGELIFAGTISQTTSTKNLVLQALTGASITVNNAIANNNGALNILGNAFGGASNGVTLKGGTANNSVTNVGETGLLKLGVTDALKTTANLNFGFAFNFTGSDQGTFDLAGFNQTVASLTGTKNTSNIGADSTRIVTNSVAGTSTLTIGNNNATGGTFNGVILDGGVGKVVALTKIGTGTQTLVGDSNYSGVTTISGGILAITHSNALGSTAGNTTIAATGASNGPQLTLSGGINSAENITITGATENSGFTAAITNNSGNNTLSGNIIRSSTTGGIRILSSSGSLTFSGTLSQTTSTNQLTFVTTSTGSIIVDNAITNNGGALFIYGGGAGVTLKGVSGSGIGASQVSQGGTLKLGVTGALNTSGSLDIGVGTVLTTDTGTFDLAGFDQTVNALSGIGTAATNSSRRVINSVAGTKTLTVGNGGGTGTFNGVILTGTGQVALVKAGSGTQTLNGTNTSTGGTRIDNGILALGHATDTLANAGAVNVNGGTLALGTNTDTVGAVTLTSGSVTGTGAGTLTGTSYDVRSGSASAILAGSGVVLTKTTAGTVTLSGVNSYTGATTITTGTLQLDGSTHASSAVGIGTAGTLSGSGTVNGNATLTGGGIINKSAGSIAGTLGVTGGNWNGAGTVTGAVTSSSGTFTIGSGANLTATTGVSATGGALVVNGTLTGTLNANSSTTVSGTGTITGNATISGIHNPGNSPGIQNIGGNLAYTGGASVVNWELVGNTSTNAANPNAIFDQLIVGGNLDFTNLTTINLAFNVSGSVLWANTFWDTAQSWTLYDVTGTTTNFSNLNLTSINWLDSGSNAFNTVRSGNSFSLTQSGSDVILNYNVVPEPRAALLGGLGMLVLLRRRRK